MPFHPAYFETLFRQPTPPLRWPEHFAIISAYATTGEVWSPEQNESADRRLAELLAQRSPWTHRLVGFSPTTDHAEPSWAVELPLSEARAIGTDFAQDAIYFVHGDELRVVSCGDPSSEIVGPFRERIVGP